MQEKTPSKTSKSRVVEALEETKKLPAQTQAEVRTGLTVRRTTGGIPVLRLHYAAHPDRNPDTNPEWKQTERKLYTSQASWDREQEVRDEAGGGEQVFADTLITYWNKIVITDPRWRPDPNWRVEGGNDYGKTNPTVIERSYWDHDGTGYFCGEYYQPGMEVWQHAPRMKEMQDIFRMAICYSDPTIFNMNMEQGGGDSRKSAERAKSVAELYDEQGLGIFTPFHGDRSDVSFSERLMMHWANLEENEPTIKIVCRNYSERPQYGLHQWDSPNLIWELMRTRRVKLTAQQMLNRNVSEAIVDKDNHARDAMKYTVMSHPEPTRKPMATRVADRVNELWRTTDPTQAMLQLSKIQQEEREKELGTPTYYGGNIRQQLAAEAAKNRR